MGTFGSVCYKRQWSLSTVSPSSSPSTEETRKTKGSSCAAANSGDWSHGKYRSARTDWVYGSNRTGLYWTDGRNRTGIHRTDGSNGTYGTNGSDRSNRSYRIYGTNGIYGIYRANRSDGANGTNGIYGTDRSDRSLRTRYHLCLPSVHR